MLTIDEYLAGFKQAGILDHLSAGELAAFEDKAHALDASSPLLPLLILQEAPRAVFATRNRKHSGINPAPADYESFLNELPGITHGRFTFETLRAEPVRGYPPGFSDVPHMLRDGIHVHFELGGRPYERTEFINPNITWNKVETHSLVYLVNKALSEAGRDERFYWILFRDDYIANAGPYVGFALIFLTPRQRRELGRAKLIRFHPDQHYTWTQIRIDEFIEELRGVGLLDHLSSEACVRAYQDIQAKEIGDLSWMSIVGAYPEAVCWFDTEMISDPPKNYTRLITDIAAVAHGDFDVRNIQVTTPTPGSHDFMAAFDLGGKTYACQMTFESDWVEFEFLQMMNRAAAEQGKAGRFVFFDTEDQTAMIAYLTEEQQRRIRESDVMRLAEW